MPSRRHDLLAWLIPRMRRAQEQTSPQEERTRVEAWHRTLEPRLPTQAVRGFEKRFSVVTEMVSGPAGPFPTYVVTPRHRDPRRTVVYLHGGGYVAGLDPFHVRYLARLALALDARVVVPDYPLAPEHTWRDSHEALADLTARWTGASEWLALAGDSAGGGYALAVAQTLRDRAAANGGDSGGGGPQPDRLLLISPWLDASLSTPGTEEASARDPWLALGKLRTYGAWWAGSADDTRLPQASPLFGELAGLPPALMFCGTRDTFAPACRALEERAVATDWDLAYVEVADLVHVFPLLPGIPEAEDAWARTREFLR